MESILKYPRTYHLEGSRLQPGDEGLEHVAFVQVAGRHLVVEEKLDGANAGIRFSPQGGLLLQSRGHYLTGGYRERHWDRFKQWAHVHAAELWERLGTRYVLYGEWLYAKHTLFYDALPHYFLEFDLYDTEQGCFLDTPSRRALLANSPVHSVPVIHTGPLNQLEHLTRLVGPSLYMSAGFRERLTREAERLGLDVARCHGETDCTGLMEGLYVKVEEEGRVVERYKWVRASFLAAVQQSGGHWLDRPILPNLVAGGA